MQLKIITSLLLIVFSVSSLAATWTVEIKDPNTSEVKTYKFTQPKAYKLEMPSLLRLGCMIEVKEPVTANVGNTPKSFQLAEINCISPITGFMTKKVCENVPDEIERLTALEFQVVDDSERISSSKKKLKFRSYHVSVKCE